MEMVSSICWQCGDIGFKDLLVYCTRCKIASRHRYCMDEVLDGTAAINWICEDCKIKSPNSTNILKFSKTSSIPGYSSGRAAIGTNDICQGIGFVDDHLVNSQDQVLISNLRINSNLNMDKKVSYEKKIETLSCRTSAPGTFSTSSCFKLNEVEMEESGNEKSEKVSLTLQNKNRLDKSQPFVDARSTDNQFAKKMLTVNSVETSNRQTIERMSNCGISGLGASRLSPFFALNKDDIQEFGNWKLKGRRSKRRLILPSKDKLDSFNPLIDGKSANISLAVKRTLGTASPSSSIKLNEDGMGECGNEKPENKSLLLPEMDKVDKSISLADLQGTDFAAKRLSVTSVEASEIQITKLTSDFDFGGLGAGRSSSCPGLKEDEIEESDKKLKKRRLVLPSKEELDTPKSFVIGKVTNSLLAVKRTPDIEQLGREKIGQTITYANHTNGAVKSSSGCNRKEYKIEMNGRKDSKCGKLIQPIKDECCNFYPLIDGQNTNISHTGKKLPAASSVEPSDRLAMGRILNSNVNTPSEVKSSVCFRSLIPPDKEPFDGKTLKSNSSLGANAHITVRSSGCFDLKQCQVEEQGKEKPMIRKSITAGMNAADAIHPPVEAKIDRNGKEKLESGRLILDTNDHLNSLHLVTNRRGASINLADKSLHATSVVASDRQIVGRTEVKDQTKFPCQQTSQSMPVVSHVWRGTFNINKGEFGPFRAHLSNKACEKVCNLARKLPLVLHMQKLPRFAAWPNSFKVSSPTDDNIALYFSPESHRVESVLDGLVDDIINNDLMLKCHFDEVELLVFSSFLLPREHQRLYGKYYAWGVFKPRSAQPCSVPAGSHAVPNGVAEEIQVDNSLKPAKNEVKDHTDTLLKDSSQEIIEYNFCLSLVQTKEGEVMATADSTATCDEEKGRADNCAPHVCEVEGLGNRPLKEAFQEFSDFQSGGEIARVTLDSLDTCDKEKVRADCCIPSVSVDYSSHSEEGLHDCQKKLSHVNHGRSISKNFSFELKGVAEEGIERVDMANSRVRSNAFRCGIEHQLEAKKPGNTLQYAEEKQNGPGLRISRKRHISSCEIEEGEISDFDNSSVTDPSSEHQSVLEQPVTDLVTEQQSVLEQSAEDEQLGEQILSIEMSIELPKHLPGIEAGEVCDDECFDDSRKCAPTYLDLFPLHMENMGKAVRLMATKGISELNLEFGLPSFDIHHDA